MAAKLIDIVLNLSLLFAVLAAPSILLVAVWYRKGLGKPVFIWPKPEMVLLTIVFFILALVLFIVGVSCFFSHFGYLDTNKFPAIAATQYFNVGLVCLLLIVGLSMVYYALRRLLVQSVMENGLVLNQGLLPVPSSIQALAWSEIADYYVVPDYPNVSFTFIVQASGMRFTRVSVKVPIYLKDDFQAFLDKQLQSAQVERSGSEISSRRYFPEN